jgi:2'-5' RNA ligase
VRLFLAINLPDNVRQGVADATAGLRDAAPQLSWIPEARLHLTLKFFGEQPAEIVEPLRETLSGVATRHRTLSVDLGGIGAFPNFRRARVVWMGVSHEPRLELLHHDVEVACEQLGFEIEGRPFRPHLTLARVKHALDEPTLRALARAGKSVDYRDEVVIDSIDLMHSELSSSGSTYTCLAAAPLRSA